jgi:pyruvate formate lyase activating enzyme
MLVGFRYALIEFAKLLLRDAAYYHHSGGGVILSGGECLLYSAYIAELLDLLERPTPVLPRGVSVALQTGGEFDFDSACSVLRRVDRVQFDLKFADPAEHLAHTGRRNERIVHNLHRLLELDATKVEVRIPLIPGITTTDDNFRGLARILHEATVSRVSLLPYNPVGPASVESLGRARPQLPATFLSLAEHSALVARFRAILSEFGAARTTARSSLSRSAPGRCVNHNADQNRPALEEKSETDR